MKLKELINKIEQIAPLSLQEEWDNSGFQIKVHNDEAVINKVYIALELTDKIVNEAIKNKCDIIITHHPLFFTPFKCIDKDNYIFNYVEKLIKNNISVYSSHTAFDSCELGNNYYFGKLIGAKNIKNMFSEGPNYVKVGDIDEIELKDLINSMETKLGVKKAFFNYSGPKKLLIKKIGWCTGAGSDFIADAKYFNCDLYITGDIKYHQARIAREINMPSLDLGHYATENIFVDNMYNLLNLKGVEVIKSKIDINPFEKI